MTTPNIITPQIGDSIVLGTFLGNLTLVGIVTDLETPDQMSGSLEVQGKNMLLSLGVLQGPQGATGEPSPMWKLQKQVFDDDEDLPTNLTDDDEDIGRMYMVRQFDEDGNPIGTRAYLWFGTHYEWFVMGYAGPAGPVPIINWQVELLDPDDPELENEIVQTGDNYHPSLLLKIKAPRGPTGPSTTIAAAPDVDFSTPPETGDVLTFNGTDWIPSPIGTIVPKFWTMPEAAFVDVPLAIGTSVPLGAFVIPPLEWDAVPYVQGHVRIAGVEVDVDPLIVGAEIRLGHVTTGQVVARGYGNISTYVNLVPHASTAVTPNDAIAPDNGRAVVPAGATGAAATLYINAFNDGLSGVYTFQKAGSQVSILMVPV